MSPIKHNFIKFCDTIGWDAAIDYLSCVTTELPEEQKDDVYLLCEMYYNSYNTKEYRINGDPDSDLCYKIRVFCMETLRDILI